MNCLKQVKGYFWVNVIFIGHHDDEEDEDADHVCQPVGPSVEVED